MAVNPRWHVGSPEAEKPCAVRRRCRRRWGSGAGLQGVGGRIGGIWTSAEQPGIKLGEEVHVGAAAEHNVGDEVGHGARRAGWRWGQPLGMTAAKRSGPVADAGHSGGDEDVR